MASEPAATLLTVEDEPEIRKLTVMYAESLGFKVFEAEDGIKAIELVKSEAPDVIVSDMKMPRMDGMSLLKELRESGNHTPFLFLSAFTSKEYTIRALSLGAFDYLEKPFMPNELKALLHEMLRVSTALKRVQNKTSTEDSVSTGTSNLEAEIMKLSSLRGDDSPNKSDSTTSHAASWALDRNARLIRMFAAEVQNQLNHGLKALTDLKHSDSPGWQLGYLFRLMYSIRSTASSLQQNEIRELSHAMEQAYVLLRVRTSYLNKATLATLQVSHDLLRRNIEVMGNEKQISPEELATLREETKAAIQDLRSVATLK
jgi:DNA-binding response OmpR family regulator